MVHPFLIGILARLVSILLGEMVKDQDSGDLIKALEVALEQI